MEKINGRLNINIAGVVSNFNDDGKDTYIVIDGETVRIKPSSSKLSSKIKEGKYVKLSCYLENGKIFASSESN
jgi:hypothetical protein